MPIRVAFEGRLGGPQMVRTSDNGTRYLTINLAVNEAGADPEWVSVVLFDGMIKALPDDLSKGERIYIEGKLKLNRYKNKNGADCSNLRVNATHASVLDRIGRKKRKLAQSSRTVSSE